MSDRKLLTSDSASERKWLAHNAPLVRDCDSADEQLRAASLRDCGNAVDLRTALEQLAHAFDASASPAETVARVARREEVWGAVPPESVLARSAALRLAATLLREVCAKHAHELDPIPF